MAKSGISKKKWKPEARRDGINTCLTDSVARFFRISPKNVPFFLGFKDWSKELKKFYKKRGYYAYWSKYKPEYLHDKRRLYLVVGKSPRAKREHHAMLYKGNKPFWDSVKGRTALKFRDNSKPTHFFFIEKYD